MRVYADIHHRQWEIWNKCFALLFCGVQAALFLAFFVLDKVLIHDDFYWSIGDFKGLAKEIHGLPKHDCGTFVNGRYSSIGWIFAKLFMLKLLLNTNMASWF